MKPLSISIPTYNRPFLLKELLLNLCKSSNHYEIDINIFDNSTNNSTKKLIDNIKHKFNFLNYTKNSTDLGYVGNQIKCLESSKSIYTAFICDDDIYTNDAISSIINCININDELSFIALNYYSFKGDYKIIKRQDFAPTNDVLFKRAYDILNYPSVGHFSGFIFNTKIVQEELNELKNKYNKNLTKTFEKHRGIITHLANLSLSKTNLPSYFIGSRILAAREPDSVDYDLLYHLNYENLKYYLGLYKDGTISEKDFNYKKKLVLDTLPKAIMIESTIKSRDEYNLLKKKFDKILINDYKYRLLIRPLFNISQNSLINIIWKIFYKYYKNFKR